MMEDNLKELIKMQKRNMRLYRKLRSCKRL